MKALSRPMSSPNRTDNNKFATPLMLRFLRSNVSSKSRGSRSRSSPMFIVRNSKRNSSSAAGAPPLNNETQQEPTSPKVTCIGQVRARRSSSKKKKTSSTAASASIVSGNSKRSVSEVPVTQNSCCYYCYCCEKNYESKRFDFSQRFRSSFNKPRTNCKIFRKWGRLFRFGYCKKVDVRDDSSSKFESIQRHRNNGIDIDERGEIEGFSKMIQESKDVAVESCSTPPKNAFLLTRCRSAPYRSSSLAVRFWGSPLGTENSNTEEIPAEKEEFVIPTSLECEVVMSSRSSSSNEVNGELDEDGKKGVKEEKIQDFGVGGGASIHPLLLTRCKSEPAKTGERLNPETANFWKQRRSDTAESCLQLSDLNS